MTSFIVIDRIRSLLLSISAATQFLIYPFAFIFWYLLLQPLRLCLPGAYHRALETFHAGYCHGLGSWTDLAGHRVFECGGEALRKVLGDKKLFLINHQSVGDISVVLRALQGVPAFHFSKVMWIMDWVMQFLPFGFVCGRHGDFFILQPSDVRRYRPLFGERLQRWKEEQSYQMEAVIKRNFNERNFRTLVIFPEGGLLGKRRASSQRYASANGHPHLERVTLPRVNGFLSVMNALGSEAADERRFKWIVDVTIAYPEQFGLRQHFFRADGRSYDIVVNYRVFSCEELFDFSGESAEAVNERMSKWIVRCFTEKEKLLEHFFDKGYFPSYENGTQLVAGLDAKKLLLFHLWSISSLLFAIYLLRNLWFCGVCLCVA